MQKIKMYKQSDKICGICGKFVYKDSLYEATQVKSGEYRIVHSSCIYSMIKDTGNHIPRID